MPTVVMGTIVTSLQSTVTVGAVAEEEMGLSVYPWSEFEKVGYLLQGIYPGILEAIKNAILADGQGLRKNFADDVRQCKD